MKQQGVGEIAHRKLHNLHFSADIIRVKKSRTMRGTGHVERTGYLKSSYKILVEKPDGNIPLARSKHRREDNKLNAKQGVAMWAGCI
jgi:hypothetical protein